jgi:hypothetical protein
MPCANRFFERLQREPSNVMKMMIGDETLQVLSGRAEGTFEWDPQGVNEC